MFNYRKDDDNLYTLLQVKTTASAKDIKLAYYKLAKKYHPDFNPEGGEATAEMFKKVNKAYEVLSNPISRQTYDIENRINEGFDGGEQTVYTDAS
jgi:DnaJ-class molecular chaperone